MELCDLYILDQDYAKAAFCCEEVWQLVVGDSLESNCLLLGCFIETSVFVCVKKEVWNPIVCCPGASSQPPQPSVPSEASRDPIHLGWL